jgi:hypothetical protein
MPKVTIHSLGRENKATVIVNGVKREFPCDKPIEISDEHLEAVKNSRFDVTEDDSALGSATETGGDEKSPPVHTPEGGENDGNADNDAGKAAGDAASEKQPAPAKKPKTIDAQSKEASSDKVEAEVVKPE